MNRTKRNALAARRFDRRRLLAGLSAGVAVATVAPRHVLGAPKQPGANEKINIAGIGVGGQGWGDIQNWAGENIVALCDVDEGRAAKAIKRFGSAKFFKDGRKMLDEMDKQIDAVLVATPDHTHAVHAINAIKRDKHVYCEKPLAHSIAEVRALVRRTYEPVVTFVREEIVQAGQIEGLFRRIDTETATALVLAVYLSGCSALAEGQHIRRNPRVSAFIYEQPMDHSKVQPGLQIFGKAGLITARSNPRLFQAKLRKWNLDTVMRSLLSPLVKQQKLEGDAAKTYIKKMINACSFIKIVPDKIIMKEYYPDFSMQQYIWHARRQPLKKTIKGKE